MLMNSAPAELLQLLTIAALQPSSTRSSRRQKSVLPGRRPHLVCTNHEMKKPPCLNGIRQCGSVFAVRSGAYLCESTSYFDRFFLSKRARKIRAFSFRQFQSRKVHENLTSAQLAHSLFRELFSIRLRAMRDARRGLHAAHASTRVAREVAMKKTRGAIACRYRCMRMQRLCRRRPSL